MSKEDDTPLQRDMFSDELVDTRTAKQKKHTRERELPKQGELFSPHDVLQFGVTGRPRMPIPEDKHFTLEMQDPRTLEEKERDRQRAAEELTHPLLSEGDAEAQPPDDLHPEE